MDRRQPRGQRATPPRPGCGCHVTMATPTQPTLSPHWWISRMDSREHQWKAGHQFLLLGRHHPAPVNRPRPAPGPGRLNA